MKKNTKVILSILLGFVSGNYLVSKTIPKLKAKLFHKRYTDAIGMRLDLVEAIASYNYVKYKMPEAINPDDLLDESCIVSLSKAYYIAENHMLKKIQYRDLFNDSSAYDKLVSVIGKIERYEPEYSIRNMYPSIFSNHTTEKETPVIDFSQFKGEPGTANPDNPLKKYFK